MPNLATVLKEEIARLARKEVRQQIAGTKRLVTQQKRDIAALKRKISDLEKKLAWLKRGSNNVAATAPSEESVNPLRFSPKSVRAHRHRLGISAEQYAKLLGVSMQTVYHWEQGKSRPRRAQLATLANLRKMGKREALRQLETLAEQ